MNRLVMTAIAAFIVGSISTGVLLARAQNAGPGGPPPAAADGAGMRGPGMRGPEMMGGPGMGGPGMAGPGGWFQMMRERHERRGEIMRLFALFDRPDDRELTPADVQKIAEAFLLWNGNHTWKIINVKPDGDVIDFDLATADGSVIARYSMDPKTGRPKRLG